MNLGNFVKPGPVDVLKREIINEVAKCFYIQLFVQYFSPFGAYTWQKFYVLIEKIRHEANILNPDKGNEMKMRPDFLFIQQKNVRKKHIKVKVILFCLIFVKIAFIKKTDYQCLIAFFFKLCSKRENF